MIGRTIHQYRIVEKLGEGGMGVVYKAEDTRLHRTVALKFLHPAIVASPDDQQRLVTEARAAAGLGHPNICTVYEINEIEGSTFIAMQYVEGTTLRDRVLSGRIDTADALRYLIQIADGLKQAHEKGIVHRDMKSSNIMITTSGRAVIMDFGLARPFDQGRIDERFTSRGTSAYMSPEQARGEPVDQRTDIWSLGVVLYEMLAGRLPFRGDYEQAVIYSILNESHRPLAEFRPGLPSYVTKMVDRCLAKNADERYQSLDELMGAVRRALDQLTGVRRGIVAPGRTRTVGLVAAVAVTILAGYLTVDFIRGRQAGGGERIPIAVIDFDNDTDEPALDGLSGMLITALEQSRRLSVMTRSRMFDILKTLGRHDVDRIDEALGQRICDATGVEALVIPTIRRFGDLYTIDLKIMNARSHKYIYTTRREARGQDNIPGMIDAIARAIRIDLREASDTVANTAPVADVTTPNLDAYQAYFEGETLLNDLDFADAGREFQRAIEIDSTFALAYYRLAYTEWWSRGDKESTGRHIGYAIDHLDRIPLKERYLVRALKAGLDEGFEAQIPILTDMRLLYPNDKEMLFGLGDAEFHAARYDSAEVHFRDALAMDPGMDRALQHLTWTYMRLERHEDTRRTAEQWVQHAPSAEAYEHLALAHLRLDDPDRAMGILNAVKDRYPDDHKIPVRMAMVRFAMGEPYAALHLIEQMQQSTPDDKMDMISKAEMASQLAWVIYPYLGRYRDAFQVLEFRKSAAAGSLEDSTWAVGFAQARSALTFWAYQDAKHAATILDEIANASPKYKTADYWYQRAIYSVLAGDTAHAGRVIAEHVKETDARRGLFRAFRLAYAGDCSRAATIAEALPGRKGYTRHMSDLVAYFLGSCQLESGDYTGAIASFRKILDTKLLSPDLATMYGMVWLKLGVAYEENGEISNAASCYRKVIEMLKDGDPDVASIREARLRLDRITATRTM